MKSFNKDIYNRNLKDLRSLDKNELKNTYYSWVLDIASGFPTDQVSVGCLDRNDIMQECFLAFENAWGNLDWDAIHENAINEPAMVWAFLKKSIKNKVRNRISRFKDGVKVVWNNGINSKNLDDFLTILFQDFHEDAPQMWPTTPSMWDAEKLHDGLQESMRHSLKDVDRLIVEYFYGIDNEKLTYKKISEIFSLSENTVRKRKQRAVEKLNNEDTKKIIRNFF